MLYLSFVLCANCFLGGLGADTFSKRMGLGGITGGEKLQFSTHVLGSPSYFLDTNKTASTLRRTWTPEYVYIPLLHAIYFLFSLYNLHSLFSFPSSTNQPWQMLLLPQPGSAGSLFMLKGCFSSLLLPMSTCS